MTTSGFPTISQEDGLRFRNILLEEERRNTKLGFPWPGLEDSYSELGDLTDKKLQNEKRALVSHGKSGSDIATDPVRKMTEEIRDFREANPGLSGDKFEAGASAVVYQGLSSLPYDVLIDYDFWRYVALRHFADVIMWRHAVGGRTKVPGGSLDNWGLGSQMTRCVPLRIFLRGSLSARNIECGGRALTDLGDVDVWASHVWSQAFAAHIPMADAQFEGISSMRLQNASDMVSHLRQLPKRLKVIRSDVVFEALNLEECRAIVDHEVQAFGERLRSE